MNEDATKRDEGNKELVESALATWCDLLDQDKDVDRNVFVSQYPEAVRDDLLGCLQAFDFIQTAKPPEHQNSIAAASSPNQPGSAGSGHSMFGLPFRLGDFEVEKEIGRGGMGVVYRATQVSLNRPVAIKILPFAAMLDGRQLERFRNEARAAAMLKHPNIVSVLSVGYERGLHYYAMELVEGCNLADFIRVQRDETSTTSSNEETSPIAELSTLHSSDRAAFFRSVARIGTQVGSALQAAHEAFIVHRDIKPSNLLLDRDARLLVADFGLARMQSDQGVTMTGDLVGTLRYMSPEQLQDSQHADQRSDIYSLGITLFELAAGTPAFASADKANLVTEITDGTIPRLERLVPDIPRDLNTVIAKAAATSPVSRYQNASELVADLERFVAGKPVLARRVGTLEHVVRWSRRNRAKAALIGVLTTLLVVAAVVGPLVAVQQANEKHRQAELVARQRHEKYNDDMRRAQTHLEHNETDQAIRLLQKYLAGNQGDVDYRKFEWGYLAAQCQLPRSVETLAVTRAFRACDLSHDEELLATGNWGGEIAVFDATTGRLKWQSTKETAHRGEVHHVRFSNDSKLLITCSIDRSIKLFDSNSGSLLASKKLKENPIGIATHGDKLVVCLKPESGASDSYQASTNLQLFGIRRRSSDIAADLHESNVSVANQVHLRSLDISPDGRYLTGACADGNIRIWNATTLELLRSRILNHHERITSAVFSSDGSKLLLGTAYRQRVSLPSNVHLVDVRTLATLTSFPHPTEVRDAKFVDDKNCITTTRVGTIRKWSIPKDELLVEFPIATNRINELAIRKDGTVYAASQDGKLMRIPQLSQQDRSKVGDFWGGLDLAFHPNGTEIACTTANGGLRIYDTVANSFRSTVKGTKNQIWGVSYSSDGKYLAATGSAWPLDGTESELLIFDALTGKKLVQTPVPEVVYARSIRFSPHDDRLAVAGSGKLLFFDVESRQFSDPFDAGGGQTFYVDFSGDGKFVGCLSSWSETAGVRIWEYPTMKQVVDRPEKDPIVWGFALDRTGKRFAVADHEGADHAVSVRTRDGALVHSLIGHTDYVTSANFSPDDQRLVTSGKDGQVILWNLATGQEILRFREHSSWAWRARFSPDGLSIASGQSRADPSLVLRKSLTLEQAEAIVRADQVNRICGWNCKSPLLMRAYTRYRARAKRKWTPHEFEEQ